MFSSAGDADTEVTMVSHHGGIQLLVSELKNVQLHISNRVIHGFQ